MSDDWQAIIDQFLNQWTQGERVSQTKNITASNSYAWCKKLFGETNRELSENYK